MSGLLNNLIEHFVEGFSPKLVAVIVMLLVIALYYEVSRAFAVVREEALGSPEYRGGGAGIPQLYHRYRSILVAVALFHSLGLGFCSISIPIAQEPVLWGVLALSVAFLIAVLIGLQFVRRAERHSFLLIEPEPEVADRVQKAVLQREVAGNHREQPRGGSIGDAFPQPLTPVARRRAELEVVERDAVKQRVADRDAYFADVPVLYDPGGAERLTSPADGDDGVRGQVYRSRPLMDRDELASGLAEGFFAYMDEEE